MGPLDDGISNQSYLWGQFSCEGQQVGVGLGDSFEGNALVNRNFQKLRSSNGSKTKQQKKNFS